MRRQGESGFSVIETLVAMAILSVALLALLNVKSQLMRDAARQQNYVIHASATRNAVALLREVNPMLEPQGARSLGAHSMLIWRAAPISPVIQSVGDETPDGDFEVALYRLDVNVTHSETAPTQFSIERVGWRLRTDAEQ